MVFKLDLTSLDIRFINLLLKAANKENFDEELQFVTEFYGDDLNIDQLRLHLDIMSQNLPKFN